MNTTKQKAVAPTKNRNQQKERLNGGKYEDFT